MKYVLITCKYELKYAERVYRFFFFDWYKNILHVNSLLGDVRVNGQVTAIACTDTKSQVYIYNF